MDAIRFNNMSACATMQIKIDVSNPVHRENFEIIDYFYEKAFCQVL